MNLLVNLLLPNTPEKLSAAVNSEFTELQSEWSKLKPRGGSINFDPDLFLKHGLKSVYGELFDPQADYSILLYQDTGNQFDLYFFSRKPGQQTPSHVRLESQPAKFDIRFFAAVGAININEEAEGGAEEGAIVDFSLIHNKRVIENPSETAFYMIAAARSALKQMS